MAKKELPQGMINDLADLKYAKDVKAGMKIGRWVVVKDYDGTKSNSGLALIQVQCSCNDATIKYVAFSDLKRNSQISCGCYRREYISKSMKGKKHSEQQRRKNSEAQKRLAQQENYVNPFKGKHHTEETKRKNSEAHKNPNITDEERRLREDRHRCTTLCKQWSKDVKENANYTCDCCGMRGGKLHSHHLNDYHSHKELATNINNGVCLCEQCHKEFHSYMGGYHVKCTGEDYYTWRQLKREELDSQNLDSSVA